MDELWAKIGEHRAFLVDSGLLAQRRGGRLAEEVREIVLRRLESRVASGSGAGGFDRLMAAVESRRLDPYDAAEELLAGAGG